MEELFPFSLFSCEPQLYKRACPSVGWLVGWLVGLSVTHLFNDPHVAPYWPTWPCYIRIKSNKKVRLIFEDFFESFFVDQ